ncbi:Dbl homology domain-containing protein [Coprinopsis sp. MPI-PUGE-AT-0042]|nr:Dbl homology domain-containing protein [Coprinopsis sp. MPI-PUGE-AT-0042]
MSTQASSSTSPNLTLSRPMALDQQCSSLRARLLRIRGFQRYFDVLRAQDGYNDPLDPVTQLQDLFCLGISLCYLFDQLPDPFPKINNGEFNQAQYDVDPAREKKRAIALFAMQIRSREVADEIPGLEPFSISDLWDRTPPTDGFVKAVNTISAIVSLLPEGVFEGPSLMLPPDGSTGSVQGTSAIPGPPEASTNPGPPETSSNVHKTRRALIIREIIDTERRFVERLELMQTCITEVVQQRAMDQDTVHQIFPNLHNILYFHQQLLTRLETTLEQAWSEQRWGQHFVDCEDQLIAVYEPYCTHFATASELLASKMDDLVQLNALTDIQELRTLHACPISRDLVKVATADITYPHLQVLKQGLKASKRIFTRVNEALDRGDRQRVVNSLDRRVTDWKGHEFGNFGNFLLDETLRVTKSGVEREFYVCLFEKVILCCKEVAPEPRIRPSAVGNDGRIYVSNLVEVIPQQAPRPDHPALGIPSVFPLKVWWRGDQDLESFTLAFKRQDQMRRWETEINRLIREAAQRSNTPRFPRLTASPILVIPHSNRAGDWENTAD